MNGIINIDELKKIRGYLKRENKKVVFTNGCFDIIHAGHVDYLLKAKELGDVLIVGLNSDRSVKRIKGDKRPIINERERALILLNIKPVDYVVMFEEDTPQKLIQELVPDILVKGGDWKINDIVGKDVVENNGGEVKTITFSNDQSTSQIIQTITERYKSGS